MRSKTRLYVRRLRPLVLPPSQLFNSFRAFSKNAQKQTEARPRKRKDWVSRKLLGWNPWRVQGIEKGISKGQGQRQGQESYTEGALFLLPPHCVSLQTHIMPRGELS